MSTISNIGSSIKNAVKNTFSQIAQAGRNSAKDAENKRAELEKLEQIQAISEQKGR